MIIENQGKNKCISINQKLTHENIIFYDSKNMLPANLVGNIRNYIEMKSPDIKNDKKYWNFYVVDRYREDIIQQLKTIIQNNLCHTRTVLVISGSLDKNIIKYLYLPIKGIVSLTYLTNEYKTVLSSLEKYEMFLDHDLQKELISVININTPSSIPVKKFILNKNKITINLSEREYQLLQFLLDGYNVSEIANKMSFSQSTISQNLGDLLKKMKASSRTAAAVEVIRNGWIYTCR
ncbi:response regulator transcription factor [Salipaludibacillus aurantiacus]|uniref:Regulatory protein, luxR family n=1 Tax=Salipaludibacillus aurantiacus TaxID=1601833 RepID=A0A1H9UFJ7_9BACI|nr:LuxR C-terminal-related transcriptional regulator [Salipaludibacillus aurantiacus]SES08226.1 regulatory protein, luxR family [Salipaludibacillus aurantiacus]